MPPFSPLQVTVFSALPTALELEYLCRFAILAPSVHNLQPWKFRLRTDRLEVRLDPSRLLRVGDPTGRQTWISLGACVANLEIAGAHYGLRAMVNTAELGRHDHPIGVELQFRKRPASNDPALFEAILQRFSDRSLYLPRPIPNAVLQTIADCSVGTATVLVSADRKVISSAAALTGRAIAAAFSQPAFRHELAGLIHAHNRTEVGFTPQALGLGALRGRLEKILIYSGITSRSQAAVERQRMTSAAALMMVVTPGDSYTDWLDAGRAYQRALLAATAHGVHSATSAAVVEAFDFHSDIEAMMETEQRLQAFSRLGFSRAPYYRSPRLPLARLLDPA